MTDREPRTLTVVLTVRPYEVIANYRWIQAENAPGREAEAIDNVKGAVLHCLGDMDNIPDVVRFVVVREPLVPTSP